jgi:RND superfamily putative drug exporter
VITSAALIMVSVFCAFLINGDPNIKQFGLGMAAAVAVDATIVRCLLVPAVMTLLDRRAWWMPKGLDDHLPKLSIEGEEWFAERDAAAAEALADQAASYPRDDARGAETPVRSGGGEGAGARPDEEVRSAGPPRDA